MLRAEPKESCDLMIAARNRCAIAFDNMSVVPGRLSDDLCRLATGAAFQPPNSSRTTRKIFDAQRPIVSTASKK
jgi:hypothetical protein